MKEVAIERKKHHERAIRQVIERHRQRMQSAGEHQNSQGVQTKKDQELENKKIIFNKYVKGKGSKKGKENAKLELVQLFE